MLMSSRNCHFSCFVACGAFGLVPARTPLGKSSAGPAALAGMPLLEIGVLDDELVESRPAE